MKRSLIRIRKREKRLWISCSFFLIFYPSISLIFARSLTNFNFVRLLTNFWDNYPIMILLPNLIFNIWLFYIILQLRVLLKIDSFNLAQIWIRFTRNHTRVIDNDLFKKYKLINFGLRLFSISLDYNKLMQNISN